MLDLVAALRRELDTAILYISHNLGVIARICDRVGVMYAGELMEEADVTTLFMAPRHPYTRSLLRCVPRADAGRAAQQLAAIPGQVPSPGALPPGCVFEPRCGFAARECRAAPRRPRPWPRGTSCAASAGGTSASSSRRSRAPERPTAAAATPAPLLRLDQLRAYYYPPRSSWRGSSAGSDPCGPWTASPWTRPPARH